MPQSSTRPAAAGRRALRLVAWASALLIAEMAVVPGIAAAGTSSVWCAQFAQQASPAYRGWRSATNSVYLSGGPDMQAAADTVNGSQSNHCQPVSGWSAEVGALGFYYDGSAYVGCPGAYSLQMSTTGIAYASVVCDDAQYYQLATAHRVWFAGVEHTSGWRYLYANW